MAIRHILLRSMTASHFVLVHTQHAHVTAMALVSNMTASRVVWPMRSMRICTCNGTHKQRIELFGQID